ncbi:MAG: hypothetical protein FWG42_09975 [Clostridiales bacterium]|nr:hypothetical protein [Clostridiales bacterium]
MSIKIKALVAMATTCALLATGSFAYEQAMGKVKEFVNESEEAVLHDDYDPEAGMKDIYVENKGTSVLFIRVKLTENMSLSGYIMPDDMDSMWETHLYGLKDGNWDCGNKNQEGESFHDYFKWTMGGSKWYMPAGSSQTLAQDTNVYDGSEDGVKMTPYATVIYCDEFIGMGYSERKDFSGWVFTEDGFAYWSQPLKAGEATGLILNGVEAGSKLKGKDYCYAINVQLEAVGSNGVQIWKEGMQSTDVIDKIHGLAEVGESEHM